MPVLAIGITLDGPAHAQPAQTTARVSIATGGAEAHGTDIHAASQASVSDDGRFVAFVSAAPGITPSAGPHAGLYLRDVVAGTTMQVDVGSNGTAADGRATNPVLSGDGRCLVFESTATNLVAGDTNGGADPLIAQTDVFLFDRLAGRMQRVSVASDGSQGELPGGFGRAERPSISSDGRVVVYESSFRNLVPGDTNGEVDVFVHDTLTGSTFRVSVSTGGIQANGSSAFADISADGRFIAFESTATNLVAGDTNGLSDIFVHDRVTRQTTRVSTATGGGEAGGASMYPAISADGRHVAFLSQAPNLVPGDTNQAIDVFRHDRHTRQTSRVSEHLAGGTSSLGASWRPPAIGADGRFVVYTSPAADMIAGDTNGREDVFLRDVEVGTTTRINIGLRGAEALGASVLASRRAVSGDARYAVFDTFAANVADGDANGASEPIWRDLVQGRNVRLLVKPDGSQAVVPGGLATPAALSGDGRFVVFNSSLATLVPRDTNQAGDVFLHDRFAGTTTRISVPPGGGDAVGCPTLPWLSCGSRAAASSVSADGRHVVFTSATVTLGSGMDLLWFDRSTGTTERIGIANGGAPANSGPLQPSLSADGRFVVFTSHASNLVAGDTNGRPDVFVLDLQTRTTTLVSGGANGTPADNDAGIGVISGDGRFVAFTSWASNVAAGDANQLSDVFLHDRQTASTTLVSRIGGAAAGAAAEHLAISADGRYVAFASQASIVAGDANGSVDIFVYERLTGATTRVSVATHGAAADGHSSKPSLSADGRYVAFASASTNLVLDDTNGVEDVFVHDRHTGSTTRASVSTTSQGNAASSDPMLSGDGLTVAFGSEATNLVPADRNLARDVFVRGHDDHDGDSLPDAWESLFGLDPVSASGGNGAGGDPDADGVSNLEELAAGTHPRSFFRRYLAEGATGPFFDEQIALANPDASAAIVLLRFLRRSGEQVTNVLTVPAGARRTVAVDEIFGLDVAEVSAVIESDRLVVVDRTMTWDWRGYGSHAETAAPEPSATWYFAEGSTVGDFALFYLLSNPDTTAADVRIRFLRPAGPPIDRAYTVTPGSRTTVWVDTIEGLDATDVSAVVESINGVRVVAERSMYFSRSDAPFAAGHSGAGVPAPAARWFLAEGATGPFFDAFLLAANPSTSHAATLRVTYLLPSGAPVVRTHVVAPASRTTIWTDHDAPELANTAFSTVVDSLGGEPVVVERAMWWPFDAGSWQEAHVALGAPTAGRRWGFAEGEVSAVPFTDTYLLIANTDAAATGVRVTLLFEEGAPVSRTYAAPGLGRFTVNVGDAFPEARGLRFGAVVESIGPALGLLVVERAMYAASGGAGLASGSCALGTQLPS